MYKRQVLGYGIKDQSLTSAPAKITEGVRDIFQTDIFRLDAHGIKFSAGIGVHNTHKKSSFPRKSYMLRLAYFRERSKASVVKVCVLKFLKGQTVRKLS